MPLGRESCEATIDFAATPEIDGHLGLLIAHGSRHESANDDTRRLAEELARRGPYRIAVAAFLELAQPTIPAGLARLIEQGVRQVAVVPLLLFCTIEGRSIDWLSGFLSLERGLLVGRELLVPRL